MSLGKSSSSNSGKQFSQDFNQSSAWNESGAQSDQNVWGSQSPFLQDLYSKASGYASGDAPQYYGGNLVAGFNDPQQQGQDMALGFAQGGAQDVYNQSAGAFGDALNVDPANNPYFASAYGAATRPLMQQFTESILPSIRSGATQAGQSGSTRQGIAEGIATRGLIDQAGGIAAQMGSDAYNTGVNARLGALNMAPNIQNLGLTPSNIYRDIGAEQQGQEQRGIDSEVSRYLYNQDAPYTQLQRYAGLLGGPTVLGSSSSFGTGGSNSLGFGTSMGTSSGSSNSFSLGEGR